MKKGLKAIIPILVIVAVVLTSLIVFVASTGAADGEVTLGTRTTTLSATYGYITAYGSENSVSGSFAEQAAKLAGFAPTANTRYTLTLNQNVSVDTPVIINTNQYTEVVIDLNGYTLTTNCETSAFVVNGAGTVRFITGFLTGYTNGRIVAMTDAPVITVSEGATANMFINHVDLDVSTVKSASAITVLGGKASIRSSSIKFVSAEVCEVSPISVKNATLEVKSSDVNISSADIKIGTAITADKVNVYVEGNGISAKKAISATESVILAVDGSFDVAEYPYSVDTATKIDLLGGEYKSGISKIATDGATLKFWYGTGSTKLVGINPEGYDIQSGCSFASKDGYYTITTTATSEAMQTIVELGGTPAVTNTTYTNAWKATVAINEAPTVIKVYIATLLKDATATSLHAQPHKNENANCITDLNGHNLTITLTKSANFDIYGNGYFKYEGQSVDGKTGSIAVSGPNYMFARARTKSGEAGANEFTYYSMQNLIFYSHKQDDDNSGNSLLAIQQGEVVLDNVSMIYTGVNATSVATRPVTLVGLGSSTKPTYKTRGFVNNCTFRDTAENEFMYTSCIQVNENSVALVTNTSFDGVDNAFSVNSSSRVKAVGCDIKTIAVPFKGTASISVYDSIVDVSRSLTISSGGISPKFFFGEGKNEILVGGEDFVGAFSVETGYVLVKQVNGRFILMNANDSIQPSITMPAIFANGMVLQRNKELNVYGYCETEGAQVEVTLAGKTAIGTTVNGKWMATFEPFPAMFNQTMEVRQIGDNVGYNLLKITNINIGEIYAMSGQSNGNLTSLFLEDIKEYAALANSLKNVRMYKSSIGYSVTENKIGSGTWYEATSDRVAAQIMSAIGYVTAAKIAAELGDEVPVAILHLARGSSKIKTWLDYETLATVSPSATKEYEYWLEQNSLPANAHGGGAVGTVMYNNVIAPLEGFKIAGMMWYQGEGDTGGGYFASTNSKFRNDENGQPYLEDADNSYTEFYYALEDCFRRAFGNDQELPFYVMQLSPFISSSYETINVYNFKMEQHEMCKNRENTYLVSLATDGTVLEDAFFGVLDEDIGDNSVEAQGFIHPLRKSTVGIRVADIILAEQFGIKYADIYSHAEVVKATAKDGKVTVEFDSKMYLFYGDTVLGFEVFDGSKWHKVGGSLDGNKVVLNTEGIASVSRVRYGCGEMLLELGDGTIIEVQEGKYSTDKTNKTLTVTYNGQQYVLHMNTTDMIRTLDYGNITNASGVPMVIFGIDVVSE